MDTCDIDSAMAGAPRSWLPLALQGLLTTAVFCSTMVTIFILTLPSTYSHFQPGEIAEGNFTEDDKKHSERSGYAYYQKHKDSKGRLRTNATVQVVVLGDIGRSPRMQYHALSIASHGGKVKLTGYVDSEIHPDVQASRFIDVVPIKPLPKRLHTDSKLLFLILAPLKVMWQVWSLYYALSYRCEASKWMLIQNPPSIPTLAVAQFVCFFRNTRLIIDWHNFGYSILSLKLGRNHLLAKISEWYEGYFSRSAEAYFAVTTAMVKVLQEKWGIKAIALHDRPPKHFQPLSHELQSKFLQKLPETAFYASHLENGAWRLIVSSTSWTPDEDFSILVDALVAYSSAVENDAKLPKILAIITGKGQDKNFYLFLIRLLNQENKLRNVVISTAWLSTEDYASLLGSAHLGISLHTSSSGVDLPMKVVDMFGTGLPVAGWSKFEAWPELVKEGVNGLGFDSASGLSKVLQELFAGDGLKLQQLRQGALKECDRRWDDEWMPVAGRLFELKP